MAWSNLLSNQMVSEIDAQTSGFTLKSGQSHGITDLCLTKDSALAKYNLNTTDMSAYLDNQLVPKSAWVSVVVTPTDIVIGTQIWKSRNLDVSTYRDGTTIPQITNINDWINATTGAWCYYDNDQANNSIYGKLYNWHAVNDPRGLAPTGYHIPSDVERNILLNYLGGTSKAGGNMKEIGTTHWYTPNTGATNNSGFTALPGGYRDFSAAFSNKTFFGYFWTRTSRIAPYLNYAYDTELSYGSMGASILYRAKTEGLSVRCIKD